MSDDVLERLNSLQKIGIKLGLRNIKALLETLSHPDRSYPSILVAGTNGKGSTSAMLEAILRSHGLRTGHYTSPHLLELRERIRIGGKVIDPAQMVASLTAAFDAADSCMRRSVLDAPPTYFETLTAAALHAFHQEKVKVAVVEVGLGGRFDATNAVEQRLSIITNVEYDHQEYLGHSLREIAGEKAGILKPRVPLVTGELHPEALGVVREAAQAVGCPVVSLDSSMMMDGIKLENGAPVFNFKPWQRSVHLSLRGRHQALNAGVALLGIEKLDGSILKLDHDLALRALASVSWPGRLDLIQQDPPVLLDCAHNPNGAESLGKYLSETGWSRVVLLFSAMRDKNIATMLSRVAPHVDHAVLTRIEPLDRCAQYEELGGACMTHHLSFTFKADCSAALQFALQEATSRRLPLVVFGSIYLVGEVYRLLGRSI